MTWFSLSSNCHPYLYGFPLSFLNSALQIAVNSLMLMAWSLEEKNMRINWNEIHIQSFKDFSLYLLVNRNISWVYVVVDERSDQLIVSQQKKCFKLTHPCQRQQSTLPSLPFFGRLKPKIIILFVFISAVDLTWFTTGGVQRILTAEWQQLSMVIPGLRSTLEWQLFLITLLQSGIVVATSSSRGLPSPCSP